MSWLDLVILGIIVLSALISLIRGFVKESISLISWIVAGVLAFRYFSPMAELLQPFVESSTIRNVAGFAILFVSTLVVGAIINFIMSQLVSSFRRRSRCAHRHHGRAAGEPDADAGSLLVAGICNGRFFSATGGMGEGYYSGGCGG